MRLRALALTGLLAASLAVSAPEASAQIEVGCRAVEGGYECIHGPFEIRKGSNAFQQVAEPIPEAGYITSLRATLVDADGDRVGHHMAHLHHAVWLDPTHDDMTCPGYPDRFFASGKERTRLTLPSGYGYYWSNEPPANYPIPGAVWALVAEIDGMHEGMVHDLYLRLDVDFVPAAEGTLTAVKPVWLDVRNCSDNPVFDVMKGSGKHGRFRETWAYTMPEGGRFVAMGGHLHDGGIKLKLRNKTTGSDVFTSVAAYEKANEPWYLTSMSGMSADPGVAVAAGDFLGLTAVYDSRHTWRDVMGIMVGMLAP
jgi:Stress up-regulated Nod 19